MTMTSEIAVYESADFGSIRMFEEDGEVFAVASDIAHALGHRDARDMIRSLDDDEKGTHTVRTPGGPQEMAVITESGLYHAILMRRSACVKNPDARARVERFQRWVTHEVLPSIRRNGVYVNPMFAPTREERLAIALNDMTDVLAEQRQRLLALESENEAMRPMAELGEAVSGADGSILIGDLARLLKQNGCEWAGRNRLFERLRMDGYLNTSKSGEKNRPKQRYVEQGLFEVQERTYEVNGMTCCSFTTLVTPKGQIYFLRKYAGVGERALA